MASNGGTGYRTIVADPPWDYPEGFVGHNKTYASKGNVKWSRRVEQTLPYPAMSVQEIAALPVGDLAARDCNLFLWSTQKYVEDAFGILRVWGFRFRQQLVWHKSAASPLGGSVAPNDVEFLLVARRGQAGWTGRLGSCVIPGPQQKRHSRKPPLFLDLIESLSTAPYLEMFARTQRLGWDTWGDEALEHVEVRA